LEARFKVPPTQQQSRPGTSQIVTVTKVKARAAAILPTFAAILARIAKEVNAEWVIPPMKTAARIIEKVCESVFKRQWPSVIPSNYACAYIASESSG
jgi:hypothetical protein